MSVTTMAIGEEGSPYPPSLLAPTPPPVVQVPRPAPPGGPNDGPSVIPCPLCQRPTAVIALESHIADCLNDKKTGVPLTKLEEEKRAHDAEMERLRVARAAAIAEINRSFDELERDLRARNATPTPVPPPVHDTPGRGISPTATRIYPEHPHPLRLQAGGAFICDVCRLNYGAVTRYHCTAGCDWDMCGTCQHAPRVVGPVPTPTPRPHITTAAMIKSEVGEEAWPHQRPIPQPVVPRPRTPPHREVDRARASGDRTLAARFGGLSVDDDAATPARSPSPRPEKAT